MSQEEEPTYRTENDVVAELAARAAVEPLEVLEGFDHIIGVATPPGTEFKVLDLEEHLPEPVRVRGAVVFDDHSSLVAYVTRFKAESHASLYADIDKCLITAVLNGPDGPTGPGWGDHVGTLALRKSLEWQRWAGKDRAYMDQEAFAELIEEGIDDIVEPSGADMLELSTTFEATSSASFKQGSNLSSGARQLTYEENIDARAGSSGQVVIPKTFLLRLPVFEGGDRLAIEGRLRYRLRDGRLSIAFFLNEPKDVLRDAFASIANGVAEDTEVELYFGRRQW